MSIELDLMQQWIAPNSRVLDLGCGNGSMLAELKSAIQIDGLGIEINPEHITAALLAGVNVLEHDIDRGLDTFSDNSFDTVVMSQALQARRYPDKALDEMLRIGRESIVAFPNFANWRSRLHLVFRGQMPVSKFMPYSWYDTPNIHFCTIVDFEKLCQEKGIKILDRAYVDSGNDQTRTVSAWPNLLATSAIYRISK
jgi:methionine biosynthesis protein MetW